MMIGVEFEKAGKIFFFKANEESEFNVGEICIVETARGEEFCSIVSTNVDDINADELLVKLIRKANNKDLENIEKLKQRGLDLKPKIQEIAKEERVEIKVLSVAFTADSQKMLIDFSAEGRVDFRNFVKKLANIYKCKIELRQIGGRDVTKKLGGIGPCGRVCCCNAHLRDFDKVAIKMAKNQNLSLNPSKINGLCGKLMCCLAYENKTYEELGVNLPRVGSTVKTSMGDGVVMYNDILRQQTTVKLNENEEYKVFDVKDIKF